MSVISKLSVISRLSTSVMATPLSRASQKGAIAEGSIAESARVLENAFSQYLEGDIVGYTAGLCYDTLVLPVSL